MNYTFKNQAPHTKRRRVDNSPGEPVAGARVLIVDDELPIRMFLTRVLNEWGYGVIHVASAVEALEVMVADPADILFCDVTMPEYDGLWLAEQVHVKWPRTAIIMATAHDDPHTVRTSRAVGAVAYVTKPFSQYQLREALDRASDDKPVT